MRLHARHGWGYDASLWGPLAALLRELRTDDRGYWEAPRADPVQGNGPYLLIGHSLGAMRMMAEAGAGCRGLVSMNGFDRFAGVAGFPGVPPRVLNRMAARCAGDPDGTVADFRLRVGDAGPAPTGATGRLAADLDRLRHGCAVATPALPLLRLDGAADPLLSPSHRLACFAGRPALEATDGGHLLPLTHARWCADAIRAFMADLA